MATKMIGLDKHVIKNLNSHWAVYMKIIVDVNNTNYWKIRIELYCSMS